MVTRRPKKVFTEDEKQHIFHLYSFTSCSIARVARHFDCSPGPINIVIEEMNARRRAEIEKENTQHIDNSDEGARSILRNDRMREQAMDKD